MFGRHGRKDQPPAATSLAEIYQSLRRQVLQLDPAQAGIDPSVSPSGIWGAMMETAYPNGIATLTCLADGTTSLYTSTGGGMIGGGAHPSVVAVNQAFLAAMSAHLNHLAPEASSDLPQPDHVVLRALTSGNHLAANALENDLGQDKHLLSPVFYAAHAVITELRQINEGPSKT